MARQDKDGFVDPALVAAWRRMLWLVRGSADVVEALVPVAAGMTKEEVSRLLTRAGAPSGKGVEPVEQVLGLLGVVPRARYEALLGEYQTLLKEYESLGSRVSEAEQNIERLRGVLREQGGVDEAEELLDSWGGLVRRTLRAQAGFVRSIANAAGSPSPVAPAATTPEVEPTPATVEEAPAAAAPEVRAIQAQAREPEPGPGPQAPASDPAPGPSGDTNGAARKRASTRSRTPRGASGTASRSRTGSAPVAERTQAPAPDTAPPGGGGTKKATGKGPSSRGRTTRGTSSAPRSKPVSTPAGEASQARPPEPEPATDGDSNPATAKHPSTRSRTARPSSSTSGSKRAKRDT